MKKSVHTQRKILSLLLTLVMILSTLPLAVVSAANIKSGDFNYRILSDGTAEIMDYTGTAEVLDIPSELDEYTVTSLGKGAFNHNDTLTSVTIPDSVTNIGGWAFNDCDNLSYVTIPDSVVSIGDSAFRYCSLSSIDIPNSVKTIGSYVFYDCDNLTSVTIPESVESIDICAFSGCDSLTSIEVDENNEYFSSLDGVLFNKDKTKIIQYPAGIEQEAYTMPDSVEIVGKYSFSECDKLKDITISENALDIDYNAFAYCTGLTSVIIPEKVEDIYYGAFNYCDNLSDIYIYGRECMIFHIDHTIPLETTIHGYPDSYAEEYAKGYGNEFIPFIPTINVTATVDGEEYDGEYTAKEIVITAETYAEVYLSVDGGEWTKLDGNSINAADGVHTYDFKAVDHYVESEIASVTTKREANTPILSVEVTGTIGEWTKDNVSFKLSAENIDSGVTYYYNNGNGWIEIDGDTLTVSENTNAQYVFKCVNGVGNESEPSEEYSVMINKDIPSGFLVEMQEENDAVIIKISAGDSTNIAKYQYSVNGGEWTDVDGDSITFTEPGEYSVSIRAVSVSGVIFEKVTLTFTISKPVVDDPEPDVLKGDVDGDGRITLIDAKWILQYIAGTRQFDERQKKAADVNSDGKISTVDAKWVLQIIAGSRDAKTLELIK